MGNLFGIRRRAPAITAQDRAILQLKQQRDKIKIYQKRTESELEKNKELALQLFQKNMKERALVVFRRKKYMEEILNRTDKQLETLEQLVSDIEYTQIEVSVIEGLRVGTEALKQLNSLINIDDIQQILEDNEEAAEKQREISDILQRSPERYDEDDLLKELEILQGKTTTEQVAKGKEDNEATKAANIELDHADRLPPIIDTDTSESKEAIESQIEELPTVPEEPPEEAKPKIERTRKLEPAQ